MVYDMNVVVTAFETAKSMGADAKVMLALFEAGIVESGFRNLNYGDRDSVGYLQQRPSQGWPNPMDVPTATRSFVTRAMHNEPMYATSGQLAQSVQISAFPARYDAVQSEASTLLTHVAGGNYTIPASTANPASTFFLPIIPGYPGIPITGDNPLQAIAQLFGHIVELEKRLMTLLSFNTLARIGMGMAGGWCILIAVALMISDTTVGEAAKSAAVGFATKGKASTVKGGARQVASKAGGNVRKASAAKKAAAANANASALPRGGA